jgi:hypothetical protein
MSWTQAEEQLQRPREDGHPGEERPIGCLESASSQEDKSRVAELWLAESSGLCLLLQGSAQLPFISWPGFLHGKVEVKGKTWVCAPETEKE